MILILSLIYSLEKRILEARESLVNFAMLLVSKFCPDRRNSRNLTAREEGPYREVSEIPRVSWTRALFSNFYYLNKNKLQSASDIDSDDSNYEGSRVLNQHEMVNQLGSRRLSPPRVNKSNPISR